MQIVLIIIGALLSVLLTVLSFQVRGWIREQRENRAQIAGLSGEIVALRMAIVEGQAAERARVDERLEALRREQRAELVAEFQEHRETCRAYQDAITGVRGHPSGPYPVTGGG